MEWRASQEEEATPLLSDNPNDSHHAAPISGAIPPFTGGVHHSTEDNLRHRHHAHVEFQSSGFAPANTTSINNVREQTHPLPASMSLDDADMAAGAARTTSSSSWSEPRSRAATQPLLSPTGSTPRSSKSLLQTNLLQRPNSDNVRIRKRLNRGISDTTGIASLWNSECSVLPPPPSLMDRGYGILRGSESDFLSFRTGSSVESESSYSSNEDLILLHKVNRSASHPPYRLPTIDASPLNGAQQSFVGAELPSPPIYQQKFIVFGWDMTNYTRRSQFLLSAGGTFTFSLMYAYLQELISVELCHRKLGLFLAAAQFAVYAFLSYFFRNLDKPKKRCDGSPEATAAASNTVPIEMYLGLSILRAIDLGMTNMAMQYLNYPAKTLMKSTRIVFTMLFGVLVTKKRYQMADYGIVCLMVAGLGIFMHADAKSSAVFQPLGVIMLTISLLCDGAISNVSESIMNRYEVGQDEFIFRLYSVALFFVSIAAAFKGDLRDGLVYLTQAGTLKEIEEDLDPTWSISAKFVTLILFSTTGYLSSSCSAAITKSFGALTMAVTSTARKATTIFLSFALFPNECTWEHISGIVLFIGSLIGKSMRASRHKSHHRHHKKENHLEIGQISGSNRSVTGIVRRKNAEDVV